MPKPKSRSSSPSNIISRPEDHSIDRLKSLVPGGTLVPLRKYLDLKLELDETNVALKTFQDLLSVSLTRTTIQYEQLHELQNRLKIMDDLKDDSLYVSLRDLEDKIIHLIEFVDDIKSKIDTGDSSRVSLQNGIMNIYLGSQ